MIVAAHDQEGPVDHWQLGMETKTGQALKQQFKGNPTFEPG